MISAICWVPKGASKPVPEEVDPPSKEEIEEMVKSGEFPSKEEIEEMMKSGEFEARYVFQFQNLNWFVELN